MKREDVIKLARECGFSVGIGSPALPKFTALIEKVVADALDDCIDIVARHGGSIEIEAAIRARKDNT